MAQTLAYSGTTIAGATLTLTGVEVLNYSQIHDFGVVLESVPRGKPVRKYDVSTARITHICKAMVRRTSETFHGFEVIVNTWKGYDGATGTGTLTRATGLTHTIATSTMQVKAEITTPYMAILDLIITEVASV